MKTKKLIIAAMMLALALLLPTVTGRIQVLGSAILPMHIPVMLAGLLCGWRYGLPVGFIAPLLGSLLFGMPPLFPVAFAMAFELATYGLVTGLLAQKTPNNIVGSYISLIGAMLAGRVVWGVVMFLVSVGSPTAFGFSAFIAGAFVSALPGIILQLAIVPAIVALLKRSKVTVGLV